MEQAENEEPEKSKRALFNPLIYNVIGNLALALLTFISPTFGIGYFMITAAQLAILALVCLVNLFIKPELSGVYFLTIIVIIFMGITTLDIACSGGGNKFHGA